MSTRQHDDLRSCAVHSDHECTTVHSEIAVDQNSASNSKANIPTTVAVVCSDEGTDKHRTYIEVHTQQQKSVIQTRVHQELLLKYQRGSDSYEGDYRCDTDPSDKSIPGKTVRDCVPPHSFDGMNSMQDYTQKSLQSESEYNNSIKMFVLGASM